MIDTENYVFTAGSEGTPIQFNPLQHQLNTPVALLRELFKEKYTLYEE